jgi:hydrogenase maturation protein HypF
MSNQRFCVTVDMEGVLQGVGFRPTIQRLATEAGLCGWVQNRSGKVRMLLGGTRDSLDSFLRDLPERLPLRARLEAWSTTPPAPCAPGQCPEHFEIRESEADGRMRVAIPADLAMCPACRAEVFDPGSRFHGYPFTTCTDCGPRYTVVDAMPYDRERTSLAEFPLCDACRAEYTAPRDRRFHAESIACPACGPRVWLAGADGRELDVPAIAEARRRLSRGQTVAVKGLGGFLLACDAFDREAVNRLRERKARPDKPLAVMARGPETLRRHVELLDPALERLSSPEAPIVVLAARATGGGAATAGDALPIDLLSPDARTLGVMLPTTPLHALLFEPLDGDPTPAFEMLVMTSGNRRGEPIAIANDEAFERLAGIADAFLVHDRPIRLRNDDSLVVVDRAGTQVWRRARGFAPEALVLQSPLARRVLAMGAELKNAVAVGFDAEVVLSPHVGDLEAPEARDGLEQVVDRLPRFLEQPPEAVAVDLHPDMYATRLGRRIGEEAGLPVVEIQHHVAHGAAGMAEHGLDVAIVLAFDGTGLGPDGAIWGAEALVLEERGISWRRVGTFAPVPLPGGDAAVREPLRQLVARLDAAGLDATALEAWLGERGVGADSASLWRLQARRGLNAPPTHAAGRVFDAFAAGLGIAPSGITYEGQAAIRLEATARRAADATPGEVPFDARIDGESLVVDWSAAFARLVERGPRVEDAPALARGFHVAMADAALAMVRHARTAGGPRDVVLTGGVFMNRLLVELVCERLDAEGCAAHLPARVPPNDGGIALGQAVIAGGSV